MDHLVSVDPKVSEGLQATQAVQDLLVPLVDMERMVEMALRASKEP